MGFAICFVNIQLRRIFAVESDVLISGVSNLIIVFHKTQSNQKLETGISNELLLPVDSTLLSMLRIFALLLSRLHSAILTRTQVRWGFTVLELGIVVVDSLQ